MIPGVLLPGLRDCVLLNFLEYMYVLQEENKANTEIYISMLTFEMVCMHNLDLQRISTKIPLDT
jgi:hypothetical protein